MTSTTALPANPFAYPGDENWTDEDQAGYEEWLEQQYEATRVWGHTHRDSKGRFARHIEVWEATYDGTLCYDPERGVTHSHSGCPEIRYQGATVVADATENGQGWLCATCVKVQTKISEAMATTPRNWGTETCGCCNTERSIRKFPTVHLHGYVFRDLRRCRPCRSQGVPMPNWNVEDWVA